MLNPNLGMSNRFVKAGEVRFVKKEETAKVQEENTSAQNILENSKVLQDSRTNKIPRELKNLLNKYKEQGCTKEEILNILAKFNISSSIDGNKIKFEFNGTQYTLVYTDTSAVNAELDAIKNEIEDNINAAFNIFGDTGSTGNNISNQDLVNLYFDYLSCGCGGQNQVLTRGVSKALDDGLTPEEQVRKDIEQYLKQNNITNMSVQDMMNFFVKIDNRMESVHSWAKREGHYTEQMLSDMNSIVESMCQVEAGIRALTDENWENLVNIFKANRGDNEARFEQLSNYLQEIGSSLLPGDIMSILEQKSM